MKHSVEAVRQLSLAFCEETLKTSHLQADKALAKFREELAEGIARGEAQVALAHRIGQIFHDPYRAFRCAVTEASRATHAGGRAEAKESGVVKSMAWLASPDCCDFCRELDGKEVGLTQSYAVNGKGPYATIWHPPAHPL